MNTRLSVVGAAFPLLWPLSASWADAYEDHCALVTAADIPHAARVVTATTKPAPPDVLAGRDRQLRWVLVEYDLTLGNRKLPARFICTLTKAGEFRSFVVTP